LPAEKYFAEMFCKNLDLKYWLPVISQRFFCVALKA
jgi:hypothetical protein